MTTNLESQAGRIGRLTIAAEILREEQLLDEVLQDKIRELLRRISEETIQEIAHTTTGKRDQELLDFEKKIPGFQTLQEIDKKLFRLLFKRRNTVVPYAEMHEELFPGEHKSIDKERIGYRRKKIDHVVFGFCEITTHGGIGYQLTIKES